MSDAGSFKYRGDWFEMDANPVARGVFVRMCNNGPSTFFSVEAAAQHDLAQSAKERLDGLINQKNRLLALSDFIRAFAKEHEDED